MGQDSWYYYMQQINQWIKVSTVQCNSDFFCHISLILGYIFSVLNHLIFTAQHIPQNIQIIL